MGIQVYVKQPNNSFQLQYTFDTERFDAVMRIAKSGLSISSTEIEIEGVVVAMMERAEFIIPGDFVYTLTAFFGKLLCEAMSDFLEHECDKYMLDTMLEWQRVLINNREIAIRRM